MKKTKPVLINREISWLHFNERVLQEAMDKSMPLFERLKFLGIFSNNRDEFFRVRVGTLRRMVNLKRKDYKLDSDPRRILKQVHKIALEQEKIFNRTYIDLAKQLAKEDIFIISEKQLDPSQGDFVKKYFQENVRAQLFPIMLDNVNHQTALVDKSLYLIIDLKSSHAGIKDTQAIIKVPTDILPRFIILPSKGKKNFIIVLDDVIRYCLSDIFSIFGYDRFSAYTIKFTRDAELDIDNDVSKSFIEILSESVKQRQKGAPVRFVYEATIPPKLLKKLTDVLDITQMDNLRKGGRYHNFKDFMFFPEIGPSHLYFSPTPSLPHRDLPANKSILESIRQKDIMLHYPYHSFQYIIDLLREASIDPKVTSIKMTFYRVAQDSSVMNALINAARNGKDVSVFLEIQARFDEEANIFWTNKLKDEGVRIIQTIPGFKVHCKLILIKRMEGGHEISYANVSTGNFNESTARVYADDSLLTADLKIVNDVNNVFRVFESRYHPPKFDSLVVAPFNIRDFFMRLLNNEIRNKRRGKDAWAIIKLNSIVDEKIALKLYQASQAGVKIQIIARGICVLVPGIPGLSENIEAISIVDKFLEHTRMCVFCNNNDPKYFISSADWMPRNFDHRIEVVCPVNDKTIQKEMMTMLQIQLRDNCKARIISADHPNQYKRSDYHGRIRSQLEIYNFFRKQLNKSDIKSDQI
ncbi:MAG: polyphosphate kinase 1 [Bacteroidetes bacterium]|nr:polyphosphate kinase 1 [Bacteroidota bacterium]